MKCLLLAAGYATRLYPLTENFPKPLLPVGGKPILDWLLSDLESTSSISEYVVASNHKFFSHFQKWIEESDYKEKLLLIDDGSVSNETRIGAVGDISLAIDRLSIDDDLMVLAGDNVLDFSLGRFFTYFLKKKKTCIMRYCEPDPAKIKKSASVTFDEDDLVIHMEEKPAVPQSSWCVPPFYIYEREDVKKVATALADGCGRDAPGSFISWLCGHSDVYAMEMPGHRYDIGDLMGYQKVNETFSGIIY